MPEKEILSIVDIRTKIKDKLKDNRAKEARNYLKGLIKDEDYKDIRTELKKELAQVIISKPNASYNLIYDSLNESLEPIYFWMLDIMNDTPPAGLGLKVWKGGEDFEASVTSGYFGEIGQRASLMQQKSMEYLGTINNIIKSILNLIYDLKEFEIKLDPYNKLKDKNVSEEDKRSALFSIKGVWMDQVDSRKGRGSINLLAQDLQFVTLRDAFFYANTAEEAKKLDLNDRVSRLLARKLEEFNKWKEVSEEEIRKRYEIERVYLKSQEGTLRLYATWLKPYLIAANKLKMRTHTTKSLTNPNIVNSFSNMEIELKLFGKKELTPGSVHDSFKEMELDTKYYALTEVKMQFRSVPSSLAGQGGRHYIHAGRTDITFNGFAVDDIELDAIESLELYEDLKLIEDYIGTSLEKLQAEIDLYTKPKIEEKPKKPKQGPTFDNPFKGLFEGFLEIYRPIASTFTKEKRKGLPILYEELEGVSEKQAKSQTYLIYNLYKKTHGMPAT